MDKSCPEYNTRRVQTDNKEYLLTTNKALSPDLSGQKNVLSSIFKPIPIIAFILGNSLSGIGVTWYVTKIKQTETAAVFRTRTEDKLGSLEQALSKLRHEKKIVEQKLIEKEKKLEATTNQVLIGYILSMGDITDIDKESSLGVKYFTDLHICEINTFYGGWDKINLMPFLGCFFEIKNSAGQYKTWVMVMGSFTDLNHPERAMLVSPIVSELLVPKKKSIKISGQIRLMTKDEVIQNKECIKTLEQYALEIADVF